MQKIKRELEFDSRKDRFWYLVPLGDIHLGHPNCDIDLLERTIDFIKDKDQCLWLGLGDYSDCINPKDWRFSMDSIDLDYPTPDKQYRKIRELFKPIKDKCIGLLDGNHDLKFWKKHAHNYVDNLAYDLEVPYLTINAYIRLIFRRITGENSFASSTINIYAHHGWTSARTAGGKVNRLYDLSETFPNLELYLQGHCFSEDTELLTPTGWKSYTGIQIGDPIINLNLETGLLETNIAKEKILKDYDGPMIHFKNQHLDFLVTPNHRILYKYKDRKLLKNQAEYVNKITSQLKYPVSGILDKDGVDFSLDFMRLCGWIISDGHFKNEYGNHKGITIIQRKSNSHKIRKLLERLDIEFGEWEREDAGHDNGEGYLTKENSIVFYIIASEGEKIREFLSSKQIPDWMFNINQEQFTVFLQTMIDGDGSWYNFNQSGAYYSSNPELITNFQRLAILHGWRTIVSEHKNRKGKFVANISKRQTTTVPAYTTFDKIPYKGKIWCVSTKNKTVIAKRNGKVMITGNTHDRGEVAPKVQLAIDKNMNIIEHEERFVYTGAFLKGYVEGNASYVEEKAYSPATLGTVLITMEMDPGGGSTYDRPKIRVEPLRL